MRFRQILASLVLGLALTLAVAFMCNIALGIKAAGAAPATTSAAVAHRLHHFSFQKNDGGRTSTVHLQNPTDADAITVLSFHDLMSDDRYDIDRTIPPQAALAVPAESLSELPDGTSYSLIVSSDQPLESVVRTHRSGASGDVLASYRGISAGSALLHFGPFHKQWRQSSDPAPTVLCSRLAVWNISGKPATVDIGFFDADGSPVASDSASMEPREQWMLDSASLGYLPDEFRGWVEVRADQSIIGWLCQYGASGEAFQVYGSLKGSASSGGLVYRSHLPRAEKRLDQGSGPRTTNLFVGNAGAEGGAGQLEYHASDGTPVLSSSFALPAAGAMLFDLGAEDGLPYEGAWAAVLSADQPFVLGYVYYDESARLPVGTYGSEAADELSLPRVVRTDAEHTVITVQSLGSTETPISISYFDLSGGQVFSQETRLQPYGWTRYDQGQMPELGDEFGGSAIIESTVPLLAQVDEYVHVYALQVNTDGQGDVDIDPEQDTYLSSDVVTLTATPDLGWAFDAWSGDIATSTNPVSITMNADKTVTATFGLETYVITPTAGAGGTITPSRPQTVNLGDDITFSIAANAGYHTVDVLVDAVSQGAISSYTFDNVTADHTISATFASGVAPAFTSEDSATFVVGQREAFTVTTSGVPTPTIALSGTLPGGVTFADNGDGTGVLSGTPAADAPGHYGLTFTASNGVAPDATQAFKLEVDANIYLPLLVRAANPTVVKPLPSTSTVTVGEHFTISVAIENCENVGGYEIDLAFEPSVVTVEDAQDGGFLGSTGRSVLPIGPTIDNDAGTLGFSAVTLGSQPGPSGTGVLATITLKAVGPGSSPLNLDVVVVDTSGEHQAVTVRDGSVIVEAAATRAR